MMGDTIHMEMSNNSNNIVLLEPDESERKIQWLQNHNDDNIFFDCCHQVVSVHI